MSKVIYTHMSERAVRGLERLAQGRQVKVYASPTGGFTAVVKGKASDQSARVVERFERSA
jgi:hypothetical protein